MSLRKVIWGRGVAVEKVLYTALNDLFRKFENMLYCYLLLFNIIIL